MTSSTERRRADNDVPCLHPGCGRSFPSKRSLASHKRVHGRSDAEPEPTAAAPSAPTVPEPARPLRLAGLQLWTQVHQFGKPTGTMESLLILCEQLDERSALRLRVLQHNDAKDRAGLRAIEEQIVKGLRELGLVPALPNGDADADAGDWTAG